MEHSHFNSHFTS